MLFNDGDQPRTVEDDSVSFLTLDKDELAQANINPDTGLATDYLNHYNEVAMLVDMLESMPDVVEDILEWRPITYPEHFLITGFRAKELAIEAFHKCEPDIRNRFETACQAVEARIQDVQAQLGTDAPDLKLAASSSAEIYDLIATVGGVINPHGVQTPSETDGWSDLDENHGAAEEQAAIDALFD